MPCSKTPLTDPHQTREEATCLRGGGLKEPVCPSRNTSTVHHINSTTPLSEAQQEQLRHGVQRHAEDGHYDHVFIEEIDPRREVLFMARPVTVLTGQAE
ncbi:hypothetical protein EHF33_14010 [Deinococcus psychrotolerans]|uniref:Uncharacterized protein n=1 Tax=Deinococcus psychrotolerans TaxID=2489213 RepID=A0A3G8YGF0_9DEIO|nr:hypothetical protein [Deinococcus psychrotolerans]AZI44033.1 hypothetical protein EHF33_14010 [Deinococcus psychrotolerans]